MSETTIFQSGHDHCHARFFPGLGDTFTAARGKPCVVMAHGFGATVDSGLVQYAEALANAGVNVLAFDYRGFGASAVGGQAPTTVSPTQQQADYRAAIAHVRALAGVDPTRIITWGVSLSSGHALAVAAKDSDVAGVIAVTPAISGTAAIKAMIRRDLKTVVKVTAAGIADLTATLRHRPPVTIGVHGEPGAKAALTAPGAAAGYSAIAGPTAVNAVSAQSLFRVATYRPARQARAIKVPTLFQIADEDQSAPPGAARKMAYACRADVRHYPCDHFDIYPGAGWFDTVLAHQIHFLHRNFAPSSPYAPVTPLTVTS